MNENLARIPSGSPQVFLSLPWSQLRLPEVTVQVWESIAPNGLSLDLFLQTPCSALQWDTNSPTLGHCWVVFSFLLLLPLGQFIPSPCSPPPFSGCLHWLLDGSLWGYRNWGMIQYMGDASGRQRWNYAGPPKSF